MAWKITLGKPGDTYIIGKRWLKKKIPKTNRISKAIHKESCPGAIYDIGLHFTPEEPEKQQHLWVCIETGQILKKAPKMIPQAKPKPRILEPKPMIKEKIVVPAIKKPISKTKPVPEPELEPEPESIPTKPAIPAATKSTSVEEVKGIGKAVFIKLSDANIKTIGDLLGRHSQEIATLIGRKSDAQIKTWQEKAKSMLKGD
ncbi:MAG: hypothetical protein ACFE95_13760 [Candidatus Hodarchaeota archaeon]